MLNFVCTSSDSSIKWPTAGWEVTTATSQGMNYDSLYAFSTQLESGDLGYIDGMLVIRNGYYYNRGAREGHSNCIYPV